MNMIKSSAVLRDQGFLSVMAGATQGVVVVVSDDPALVDRLEPVCTFLELRPECVTSGMDLLDALQQQQPIAVISDIECEAQDGFHTMKVVADYHRDLPVFMMTGNCSTHPHGKRGKSVGAAADQAGRVLALT